MSFHNWGRSLEKHSQGDGRGMGAERALEREWGGFARAGGLTSPCERSTQEESWDVTVAQVTPEATILCPAILAVSFL